MKERCNACGGSGILGFQREPCWFCRGKGTIEKEYQPKEER